MDITVHEHICTLLKEKHPEHLIFSTMSGSHAYNIASVLSDYDIQGVHLLPLRRVLGFDERYHETVELRGAIEDGTEVEIVTHDFKKFLKLLLKGNGNVLETLYSSTVITTSPLHDTLMELGRGCITRCCAAHYKGMAFSQQRRMKNKDVKSLLHCYRCLLMGIHLMRTGILLMDLPALAQIYQYPQIIDLIAYKQSGIEVIDSREMESHTTPIQQLTERLEQERDRSQLPEKPSEDVRREAEDILLSLAITRSAL
jgi:predicted nucleotidyltransferase